MWDEAVKISGADSDFHRRDLWEAIEAGAYPEWELGLQIFTEEQAEGFSFDVLDATKIVPEELVPIVPVGRMVLNRNPDNFFAETEQVAFCVAHVVPGIDFSNDPLLAGRIHSYVDTQISRLGGPNFHEIPINAPIAQVHNNQRDGMHRQAIHRGRVSYEPNSLGGGCPFQAGAAGFVSFPEPREDGRPQGARQGRAVRRSLHAGDAVLEQPDRRRKAAHRQRLPLRAVARADTGDSRADGVGPDECGARTRRSGRGGARHPRDAGADAEGPDSVTVKPEVSVSPALSLFARPGDGSIRTRRVAILVADGCDGEPLVALADRLTSEGAVPRFVAATLGAVQPATGDAIEVDVSLEAAPAVLYDALVLPDGADAVDALRADGRTLEFIKDQYRHCKPILALGAGDQLLAACGIDATLPDGKPDPGVIAAPDASPAGDAFIAAIAKHRHFARETDPPRV